MIRQKFRSIKVVNTEIPINASGRTVLEMNYDISSIREHSLDLSIKEIIFDSSWILYFFLSLMISAALAGLVYAFSALAMKISWNRYTTALIPAFILFISMWAAFSVPAVLKKKKEIFVTAERGENVWRIVDEKNWERFSKLLALSIKKSGPRV